MVNVPNTHILVGSLTEDQAKLIILMTLIYLEQNFKPYLKVKKKDKPTLNKIMLSNGSQILARPVGNTGDALRGFTGDVFIMDELSRWPELALTAGLPTLLTTGGEIWGASTPFGKQGFFYEAFQNKDKFWKVIHVTSEKVIADRPISESWTIKQHDGALRFLEQQKAQMSETQYAQEYLGQFMDDLMRYFTDELIESACKLMYPEPILNGRDYSLGVDIARMGEDETAFEIIRKIGKDNYIHTYSETANKKLTTWTENRIIELDKLYNFKKIYIDAGAGSLGVGIFDHLMQNDQVKRKIVAVNNAQMVIKKDSQGNKTLQKMIKEDLYDNLKGMMNRGEIRLLNDDKVIESLRSVQYEYARKTNQPTKMRIFGNYTHIVEGLIRAAQYAKEKHLNFFISSIKI